MSGLTNTTGFSFLGLTNLTQANFDNMFVNNLTANAGTITILNSTTGTITTLNTNTIQPSPLNSNVNLYTTHTGSFTIGNTSNTNSLTINNSTILASGKTLTLNATGGKILCNVYTGTTISSNLTLGESGDTGNLQIFKTITSNNTYSGANTHSGATNTFSNTLLCNTLQGTTIGSAISLFSTSTSFIDLGNPSSTSVIRLNQNTSLAVGKILRTPYLYPTSTIADLYFGNQATDSGSLFIELNTDLHSSKRLKLNNTTASKLLLTNASKEIISSAYDETTLPVSTPQQTALNLKSNINAPVFTTSIGLTSGNLTISTSGSILSPTYNSTSATQALTIAGTNTTANVSISTGLTTGTLFIGPVVSTSNNPYPQGWITLNANTYVISGRRLSIDTGGFLFSPNISGGGTDFAICNNVGDFGANISIGSTQVGGNITLGNSTPATDNGTLTINKNTVLATNKNLTLGNQSIFKGGTNGTANITAVAFTNVILFPSASVAGFYQVNIWGASATQTYSVCCFMSADNSGAVQTIASRNMTFQFNAPNWCITATVAPTSSITMTYNVVRLV